MATPTYDPIASTTLTLPAISVTFSSLDTIAAGYRDLVLVSYIPADTNSVLYGVRINADTGNNYSRVWAWGTGSTTASNTNTTSFILLHANPSNSGEKIMSVAQFMDYSATDKHKSLLIRGDNPARDTGMIAARWANTAAITSITIDEFNSVPGLIPAGSTFSLYGIAA